MEQLKTKAIVLSRVNFGETDRIITIITPDYGKLRLMARGVRLIKSKLAGGIELFSVNEISFIQGRSDVFTLTSSRLIQNFGDILTDINRVQFGYEMLKSVHKNTEDESDQDYFDLLCATLSSVNDLGIVLPVTQLWFMSRLLAISGHAPNLKIDEHGGALSENSNYGFNNDSMVFYAQANGRYATNDIKFLRLAFSVTDAKLLSRVTDAESYSLKLLPLLNLMHLSHLAR